MLNDSSQPRSFRRNGLSPIDVLEDAQSDKIVLDDYRPLAESLEWELGQQYWQQRGSQAFICDPEPIPFVINNDGCLSMQAAEMLFEGLTLREKAGTIPNEIFVLELGIGVGLFARFFLDWFRHLCDRENKDFYHRLCYVGADRSSRMLSDACRYGIFLHHPGRYRLRITDALNPDLVLLTDHDIRQLAPRCFSAVFLNYVVDCLPASVLKMEHGQLKQLHVRTCLPKRTNWQECLDVGEEELRTLAASSCATTRHRLSAISNLLLSEYQYLPVEPAQLPYGNFLSDITNELGDGTVLYNHGAIRSIESLATLLSDGGFILVNDYGWAKEVVAEDFEHQRFSRSTSVGINFALLKRFFEAKGQGIWNEPVQQNASLYSRLVLREANPQLSDVFRRCFDDSKRHWYESPLQRARECIRQGRYQAALGEYREALARQPLNWVVMNELAQFLNSAVHNPEAGLRMGLIGLGHNPACSPDLWNVVGDSLYLLGRIAKARWAYSRALELNPDDIRARYNLAFVHTHSKEYSHGLRRIAEALSLDRTKMLRDDLLQKQAEILWLIDQQNRQRSRWLADRIGKAGSFKHTMTIRKPIEGQFVAIDHADRK